ncbi:polysaccharide deacetylase family protein [Ramlibacter sp.]|uniref:polysaccharide deacetylase family protein n=1 Tax=Ramlibacter sp. TaxID=1917967 RepID=UPI002D6E60DC|nr:polysaccharide deacetylase family protein [Ramlibacter sp.]HYD75004.1 polysaccharide deacetylase family protein [Ramlibacter sp.]
MKQARTLIVNYHYCVSEADNPWLARTAVAPDRFEQQVQQLARLEAERGIVPLVTFDDGTRDIWRNAVPVLRRHGVPGILFVCSMPLLEQRLLNVTKVHLLQARLGPQAFRERFMAALEAIGEPIELDDPARFGLGRIYRYDGPEVREFKLLLNAKLPYPIVTQLLDGLFSTEFGDQAAAAASLYMSADEVKGAQDAGLRIGLHTHSHFMLGRLPAPAQEAEIARGHRYFSDLLGQAPADLSYPYGVPGTWNADTKSILSRLGIPRAYTLGREIHDPQVHGDALEIPRFDVNDVFERDGRLKQDLAG